jgi:hypothetical protein
MSEGTTASLEDVLVRDVEENLVDGSDGRAIQVQLGARLTGSRVVTERAHGAGIVSAVGSTVELTDARIADTLPSRCTSPMCPGFGYGAVSAGASLRLVRFALERGAVCGVMVAGGGTVDLANGRVAGSEIGACVQVDGYDLARLMDRVVYEDNVTNLDTTTLPVPGELTPLD